MTDEWWPTVEGVDRYRTSKEKLALILESTCMAKALLVEDKGIGEDMPATLVGWEGDRFVCLVQATERIMSLPKNKRLASLERVACHMRDGWCTDSLTFISEGYCHTGDTPDGRPLEIAFIDNHDVHECLTFVHVTYNGTIVVAAPYEQKLGRVVEFLPISKANANSFTDQSEPLRTILNEEPVFDYTELNDRLNHCVERIQQEGWEVVHDIWNDDYIED